MEPTRHQILWSLATSVLEPKQGVRLWWDLATSLLILFDLMFVPYCIAFDRYPSGSDLWTATTVILFGLDIQISSRTGFDEDGDIVYDLSRIRRSYFKGFFVFDFLATSGWLGLRGEGRQAQSPRPGAEMLFDRMICKPILIIQTHVQRCYLIGRSTNPY